jgi:amidase
VLAGPLPEDARAWRLELPRARPGALREYRLGAWLDDPAASVDAEVRRVLENAVDALRRAGATVDDRKRPAIDFQSAVDTYLTLLYPVVLAGLPEEGFQNLVQVATALGPDDQSPLARGARLPTIRHREWLRAHERRKHVQVAFASCFRDVDALLMPVVPVAAIAHDHSEPFPARTIPVNGAPVPYTQLFTWIAFATMAHLPATVVPVGRTAGGLPVGVQIVGPYLEDRTTVDIGRHIADVLGGFVPPPGFE